MEAGHEWIVIALIGAINLHAIVLDLRDAFRNSREGREVSEGETGSAGSLGKHHPITASKRTAPSSVAAS